MCGVFRVSVWGLLWRLCVVCDGCVCGVCVCTLCVVGVCCVCGSCVVVCVWCVYGL